MKARRLMVRKPSAVTLHVIAIVIFTCVCPRAGAENTTNLNKNAIRRELKARYQGKVLRFRHFKKGRFLRYTRGGSLIQTEEEGPWTIYSLFELREIAIRDDCVQFKGVRRAVLYNASQGGLEQRRTGMDYLAEIEFGERGADLGEIERAVRDIFLTPSERLIDFIPGYWRKFLREKAVASPTRGPLRLASFTSPVFQVEDGATIPVLISKIEPDTTDEARKTRLNGSVILDFVIARNGRPRDINLVQPLGLGLDEEAITALAQWKFAPAVKDGLPTEARAQVPFHFRFY